MGAKMFDAKLNEKAGIQSKTKYINENTAVIVANSQRREEFLKMFRVMDEQDAINRYHWFNIPAELSSQEIERLLYYRGQLCFFYYKDVKKFYFMPYALDGSIDFYGRYNTIHPVPFSSGSEKEKVKKDSQAELLSKLKLSCIYDVKLEEELKKEDLTNSAVLLHDYCKQRGELIIPRQFMNENILSEMADCLSYFDTSLMVASGVEGYRVENASAKDEIKFLASSYYKSAINRTPFVAITGQVNFQELTAGSKRGTVSDFLMAFQGLDNLRLSSYGIANGGIYEKQAHILESEMAINNSSVYSPLQDGLKIRQRFCNIVNSIWGTSIWCEPSEAALKMDLDGDGVDYDREDAPEEEVAAQEEPAKEED